MDILSFALDFTPDELLLNKVYSGQIEALKQSLQMYFSASENHMNFINTTDDWVNSKIISEVFNATECSQFIRIFNGDDAAACWGADTMPTLAEIRKRLAKEKDGVTLYDRIGIEDSQYGTNYQYFITKYIEFRIHHEFKELTGITLECYYDLMKIEKSWTGKVIAPWKKNIDIDSYADYSPEF